MQELEYCEVCGEPTGRAGRLDDSIVCGACDKVICINCIAEEDDDVICAERKGENKMGAYPKTTCYRRYNLGFRQAIDICVSESELEGSFLSADDVFSLKLKSHGVDRFGSDYSKQWFIDDTDTEEGTK